MAKWHIDKKKQHRNGELQAMYFDKLPQRCKEIFFEFIDYDFDMPLKSSHKLMALSLIDFDYSHCESPIEMIFNFAYDLINLSREDGDCIFSLYPQEEIKIDNKKYRADFLFDSTEYEDVFEKEIKSFKLVIECDGHEFHEKTKSQVALRNNRDMDLKKLGYDILHFSGSQIFNEPFKCANDTLDYILSKIY